MPPQNQQGGGSPGADPTAVPGLAELIGILEAMAAVSLGARPRLDQDLIEKVKNSPLLPALYPLQSVYKKLGPLEGSPEHLQAQAQAVQRPVAHPRSPQSASNPGSSPSSAQQPTPAAAPAAAGITSAEAGLKSVSSKLDSVSQAITDMKESTKAAKDQVEAVDKKISGKLEPAVAELTQEVKRLQVDLVDEFNGERTRFERKVMRLEQEVTELEEEVKELKKEARELQRIIRDTRAELLPVEAASEVGEIIALQGAFFNEPENTGGLRETVNAPGNLLQTAKKVRTNTLGLVTKCRALFTIINRDPETDVNITDVDLDGEWGRCAEYLRTSNSRLRDAVEEKEETAQKLQFVGLVIDQMLKGHSVQVLTQDLSRLTAQPTAASSGPAYSDPTPVESNPSIIRTGVAPSRARGSPSDLGTWDDQA
ncbi:hypothetical protein FRC00_000835 [Tulasnella sp. 408]|nr:hypothetical protein FRC00_000835 [Tulasnella sp. 408]